jgi:homoserine kinase type II
MNGQTLIEYEQRLVEVEPFLPHDSLTQTVRHYQRRFAFLAQLHAALSQLVNLTTLPPPQVQNYALPKTLIRWLDNTKHRIAERDHPRHQAALAVCEMAESLLYEVAVWWEQSGQSLPRQLIHGDYGLGNVLFAQDQIAAVVDWDFLAIHERVFDLAYALYWMCYDLARSTKNFERAWQWVQGMVACYQAANQRPLTMEEQEALPIEMARVPLYWIGEAAWLDDPVEAVLSHADQIGFASWLIDVWHR